MTDSTTRRRLARKRHRCTSCDGAIPTGDPYLSGTVFPGHDANTTTAPMRLAECAACAARYGRSALLETR